MKLTLEQIRSATHGAARVTEERRGLPLFPIHRASAGDLPHGLGRFLSEILRHCRRDAGICNRQPNARHGSGYEKKLLPALCLSRHLCKRQPDRPARLARHTASGVFGGSYPLGEGYKTVQIYFPWSAASTLRFLALDDGASISPVLRPNRMLIFGDSITQGYDALYPSHSYASVLADALNADARNKGIGGEKFFPALLDEPEDFEPDYITVAYGTNDWAGRTAEELEHNLREFYHRLSALYPKARIFAVTPIWRKNEFEQKPAGAFAHVAELIEDTAAELPKRHGHPGLSSGAA